MHYKIEIVKIANTIHYYVEENYMTIFSSFSALSQLSSTNYYHTLLAINCSCIKFVHSSATDMADGHIMTILFLCNFCVIFTFFVVECDMWQ